MTCAECRLSSSPRLARSRGRFARLRSCASSTMASTPPSPHSEARPENPVWYNNLKKNPHVELQDETVKKDYIAREVFGEERDYLVGACRRGLSGLRRLPDEDRAHHPGLRPDRNRHRISQSGSGWQDQRSTAGFDAFRTETLHCSAQMSRHQRGKIVDRDPCRCWIQRRYGFDDQHRVGRLLGQHRPLGFAPVPAGTDDGIVIPVDDRSRWRCLRSLRSQRE